MNDSTPRTILVAHEHTASADAVVHWLREAGFEVVEVGTDAETLVHAAERADAIVLDGQRTDHAAFEIAHRLKSTAATAVVPLIQVSSGFTTGEWRAEGLEAGADAFLTTPVEPSELIATVRALLRLREAEEEVRSAAEEWEATFHAITDAVCILDPAGAVVRCNDAADVLLGQLNEGHGDRVFHEIFPTRSRQGPQVAADVMASGQPFRYETRVGERWFSVSMDPMPPRDHATASVVAVVSDVTARRLAEEERLRLLAHTERARKEAEISRIEAEAARREAEKANRAKSEFLAVMSHELRTPLNAIGGYAELLEVGVRGPLTETQLEDVRRIQRSQKHLLSLINDVLNFVRLDAGTVRYEIDTFLLRDAIRGLEDVTMPQLLARQLRFTREGCDGGVRVRADREKVEQVLVNLMTNAIKFTEPGGEITIQCESDAGRVIVRVRDTGRGIPSDKLSAIFEPFVQVSRSTVAPGEGVGLGLAISRELSRAMGGDLIAASVLGQGSTFTLTLPAAGDRGVQRSDEAVSRARRP